MHYLVDGYNLMHVLGLMGNQTKSRQLHRARRLLLTRLARWLGEHRDEMTVVFDAAASPAGRGDAEEVLGIQVRFSRATLADDWMAEFIAGQANRRAWTVVSNDRRILQAGRRLGCGTLRCLDFLERWERAAKAVAESARPDEKPHAQSPEQRDEWLSVFTGTEPKRRTASPRRRSIK